LQDFIREYHKQFIKLPDWKFTAAGRIERDILDLFKAPLIMYALKLNGQVIVEIYGILERYAILALVNLFDSRSDRPWKNKEKCTYKLEEKGVINKNLSSAAKHSKIKGLLNPISSIGLSDNPLVEVEYKGRQSNVILTQQGQSTLKIFGD
jgi:hypothetical protein